MSLKRNVRKTAREVLGRLGTSTTSQTTKQLLIDQEIRAVLEQVRIVNPSSPALSGFKVYSQVDEDGIIEEIFQRIETKSKRFVEVGCGFGTENNTHYLLLKGWSGTWVDGDSENIELIRSQIPANQTRLSVLNSFVTKENAAELVRASRDSEGADLDLLSIDIDGNDAAVLGPMIDACNPRVVVVEYNPRFPPPVKVSVAYEEAHWWAGDDYFGSSLQVFVDLLTNYRLVCCGISGSNAFFVRLDDAHHFSDISAQKLFMPARYYLLDRCMPGKPTLKYLENELKI
jgi:hypothetical protein